MLRSWRLQGLGETCIIVPHSQLSREEQAAYLSAQLDRWLADPLTYKAVLEIYQTIRGDSTSLAKRLQELDLHRYVKSEILQAFRRGELVLMRMPHASIFPALKLPEKQEQTYAEESPPPVQPVRKEKTWVGIELVDQDGNPVPQARYEVELPDGTKKTGKLDDNGCAQIRDVDQGPCKVTFPDFDGSEWDAL